MAVSQQSQHDLRTIPLPVTWFGRQPGDDRVLVRWPQMVEYFEEVAATSDRVRFEEIGVDWSGAPLGLLTLSSPANLARLDDHIQRQRQFSDPKVLRDPAQVAALVEVGKTIVLATCAIHSTEPGSMQMVPDLVHDLATSEDPAVLCMLDNVILLIVPCMNPGGSEIVADWYEQTLGTPHEGSLPPVPYHPHAGHDNNRDWFMFTQLETRVIVERVHNLWKPHIVIDFHQMQENGPRYVLPPYVDPTDENVDPRIQAMGSALGAQMAGVMTAKGLTGVATSVIFDAFSPSRTYSHYHGGVRILAESASALLASPAYIPAEKLVPLRGFMPHTRSAHQPVPWAGGTWRLQDVITYHRTALDALLGHASAFRAMWLATAAAVNAESLGPTEPHGFLIPGLDLQPDPGETAALVEILRRGEVNVEEATEPFMNHGVVIPAGTFLVRTAQPYGRWAKTLLERQHYPVRVQHMGRPAKLPYDLTAHTLPLQMGVHAGPVATAPDGRFRNVEHTPSKYGRTFGTPDGEHWLVSASANAGFHLVTAALASGATVTRLTKPDRLDGMLWPGGTFLVSDMSHARVVELASEHGVDMVGTDRHPKNLAAIRLPRIGVYSSAIPDTTDAGWTRFVLSGAGFPSDLLSDSGIRSGRLADRYDAIILPHQGSRELIEGNSPGSYPDEFVGGLAPEGLQALHSFMLAGGTLLAFSGATEPVIKLTGAPVVNVLDSLRPDVCSCPGSLLRVLVDTSHPVGWGHSAEATVLSLFSPVFESRGGHGWDIRIPLRYPADNPLESGWIVGAEHMVGKGALVDIGVGRGRAYLFGFRPQFRAQTRGTYRMMFNAVLSSTTTMERRHVKRV